MQTFSLAAVNEEYGTTSWIVLPAMDTVMLGIRGDSFNQYGYQRHLPRIMALV